MKFEIIGYDGINRMTMHEESCFPTVEELQSMLKLGYKFKLDDKTLTKGAVLDLIKSAKTSSKANKPVKQAKAKKSNTAKPAEPTSHLF